MSVRGVDGGAEVPLRHQVGVDVVVGDRAVLVWARDAVDVQGPAAVVVAERMPEPRGLDQELNADIPIEGVISGRRPVADDGISDIGVYVERGGASRPVAGTLLALDRPPRERRASEAELRRPRQRHSERLVAPPQGAMRCMRRDVAKNRKHEDLRVPERVAVVSGSGQPLRRDCSPFGSGARL